MGRSDSGTTTTLILALVCLFVGSFLLVAGYYYSWSAGTPNTTTQIVEARRMYSGLAGISGVVLLLVGVVSLVFWVRRINREFRIETQLEDSVDQER